MQNGYKHGELTQKIIGAAYTVYNALGCGFLEKVYENAMVMELRGLGLPAKQQHAITVFYRGSVVGDYMADLIVDDKVIVELKASSALGKIDEVQLVNYLKATGLEVGLLINFGRRIEIKRKISDQ